MSRITESTLGVGKIRVLPLRRALLPDQRPQFDMDATHVPRIGEHIKMLEAGEDGQPQEMLYVVVGVSWQSSSSEYQADVYVRRDCTVAELIARMQEDAKAFNYASARQDAQAFAGR